MLTLQQQAARMSPPPQHLCQLCPLAAAATRYGNGAESSLNSAASQQDAPNSAASQPAAAAADSAVVQISAGGRAVAERGSKHCLPETFLVVTDKGDCVAKVPLLPGKNQGHATVLAEEHRFARLLSACLSRDARKSSEADLLELIRPQAGNLFRGAGNRRACAQTQIYF